MFEKENLIFVKFEISDSAVNFISASGAWGIV
jgi:hypothetical protein